MFDVGDVVLAVVISTLSLSGIFKFWFEKRIIQRIADDIEITKRKRNAFDKLLGLWSERITGKAMSEKNWIDDFALASKDLLLWCDDSVLYNMGEYFISFDPNGTNTNDIAFAKAILDFRESIGHKNVYGRIRPEHIVAIFKAGNK